MQRALERLPYYGVFDFMAFGVDRGTVTLTGYTYHGSLKSAAEKATKRASGVDEVANRLEVLPRVAERRPHQVGDVLQDLHGRVPLALRPWRRDWALREAFEARVSRGCNPSGRIRFTSS